jgi:hypothetical protein
MLCHVVGGLEVEMHHVLEWLPIRSEEQDPALAPYLHEEPSKKSVQ